MLIHHRWICQWKASPRYPKIHTINNSVASKKLLQLISDLSHTQASLILQFCTGCIPLNKHLHCIKQTDSPACPNCTQTPQESIHHFLFECNKYRQEHFALQRKLGHHASTLSYLLTNPTATSPLPATLNEHSETSTPANNPLQHHKYLPFNHSVTKLSHTGLDFSKYIPSAYSMLQPVHPHPMIIHGSDRA